MKYTCAFFALFVFLMAIPAWAGGPGEERSFKVLEPILRGNLAIFPVVSNRSYDASQFITLDEGIRTGQVTVTEAGQERGLVRPGQPIPPPQGGAEVNRLVLYNSSTHPLLLLAGEIVTGGKQDRVIASDRIVPAEGGPIDLSVFCVEPGRWVASSSTFGSMGPMAQPSVRTPAMAEHNQTQVWANVSNSTVQVASSLPASEAAAIGGTTSYAKVFASPQIAKVESQYGGTESEQAMLRELHSKNAVGVVIAVDGQVMWADVFASTELLAKYWPKLIHSYIAEAMTAAKNGVPPNQHEAELYMSSLAGGREVVETEADVFRRSSITGDGYSVFELTSLLPKTDFIVHIAKIRQ